MFQYICNRFVVVVVYSDVMVTGISYDVTYDDFMVEMKDMCHFHDDQPFTLKWLDEEGGLFSFFNPFAVGVLLCSDNFEHV